MTATPPFRKRAETLGPLASRYVEGESLPWNPTPCPGIDMKILLEDSESGLLTALFRWQPGAELALHEHVEIEQTFVLEGSLVDDEGEVSAGNYVWRPKGNRHIAKSPNGALVLSIFLKPNIFLTGDAEGRQLRYPYPSLREAQRRSNLNGQGLLCLRLLLFARNDDLRQA